VLFKYGGVICDNTIQVRRISFYDALPSYLKGMNMKIAPYDTYITREFEDDESYQAFLDDESYYGVIPFKPKRLPMNSWTIPFVTNHRYRIHWAEGMDFT